MAEKICVETAAFFYFSNSFQVWISAILDNDIKKQKQGYFSLEKSKQLKR